MNTLSSIALSQQLYFNNYLNNNGRNFIKLYLLIDLDLNLFIEQVFIRFGCLSPKSWRLYADSFYFSVIDISQELMNGFHKVSHCLPMKRCLLIVVWTWGVSAMMWFALLEQKLYLWILGMEFLQILYSVIPWHKLILITFCSI